MLTMHVLYRLSYLGTRRGLDRLARPSAGFNRKTAAIVRRFING